MNFGNKVVIPAGFTLVANGDNEVEYKYEKGEGGNSTGNPVVQDGIVITDEKDANGHSIGNEFVWVPVGTIKNDTVENTTNTTTITLGRYVFASDGTPNLEQNATNYEQEVAIETYYKELATSTYGNSTALELGNWINFATNNGGYYIGRYEASSYDAAGSKACSKQSTATRRDKKTALTAGMLWNAITQPAATTAAQAMYPKVNNDTKVYSDLINSYAWDTTIVFIQEYSGYLNGTTKYSRENGQTFSTSLQNTGTNGDKVCNIYDMASNTWEWTTEAYIYSSGPCACRGGFYEKRDYYTSIRNRSSASNHNEKTSFRATLYVK